MEKFHKFIWSVSIINDNSEEEEKENQELIAKLLAQVDLLQREIARLQAEIAAILVKKEGDISCLKLENNLYYGLTNNQEVRCLQEFLKAQGTEIYPEGLVTGNFLTLTQVAVIHFQEKYKEEILIPLGLEKGTGFVGSKTLAKINELLK